METTLVNACRFNTLTTLFFSVYVFLILLIGLYAYRKPEYNWDMLAYMALVIKIDHPNDINMVHETSYATAQKNIPPVAYENLLTGSYRKTMATSSSGFYAQLPFYAVKPLYIKMIYVFYKMGFTLPIATLLPSILGYFLIGLLLFHWLGRYATPLYTFIACLLVMYSAFMVNIAQASTPDSLSAFLLLAAFYFIIERPSVTYMFIFLLLSVFVRLDNVVTCFFILSFLFFSGKWRKKISLRQYLLSIVCLVAAYFFITIIAVGPFGWNVLYYPAFIHYFNLSREFHPAFSVQEYLALLYSQVITAIVAQHFALFAFMALLSAGRLSIKFQRFTFDELFSMLLIFIILMRFLLFPDLSDRFYTGFYLCILVLLVKKYIKPPGYSPYALPHKN